MSAMNPPMDTAPSPVAADTTERPRAAQAHRKHWIGISKANRAEMRRKRREQEG